MANTTRAAVAYAMSRARSVASEGPAEPRGLIGYAELPPHPRGDVGILTGPKAGESRRVVLIVVRDGDRRRRKPLWATSPARCTSGAWTRAPTPTSRSS